jgi:hypothetical protein
MSSESFWKFKLRLGRALLAFMAIPLAILLVIPVRLWVGWAIYISVIETEGRRH